MDMNFEQERALLQQKRGELVEGLASIDRALAALGVAGTGKRSHKIEQVDGAGVNGAIVRARKPMSAKAKQAARQRMLAYWAAKRAEAKPAKSRTKSAR